MPGRLSITGRSARAQSAKSWRAMRSTLQGVLLPRAEDEAFEARKAEVLCLYAKWPFCAISRKPRWTSRSSCLTRRRPFRQPAPQHQNCAATWRVNCSLCKCMPRSKGRHRSRELISFFSKLDAAHPAKTTIMLASKATRLMYPRRPGWRASPRVDSRSVITPR